MQVHGVIRLQLEQKHSLCLSVNIYSMVMVLGLHQNNILMSVLPHSLHL